MLSVLAAAAAMWPDALQAEYVFNGAVNTDWGNSGNWNGGAIAPNDDSGNWIDVTSPTNGLALNADKRTNGMAIRNGVSLTGSRTLRADWISLDNTTADPSATTGVTATISLSGLQSYNAFSYNATPGDTLAINTYAKPVGGNSTRNNSFGGGGAVVINGGLDTDGKVMNYSVGSNTTLINNTYMNSNGSGSITVAAGSTYAGHGSTNVATTTITGIISPSSGNSNAGIGTLTLGTMAIDGTYAVDLSGTTCDKVAAGALTLGTSSKLIVSGTATENSYVIATYTSLTGTFDLSSPTSIPAGYALDYAFGGNQIALVKQATTVEAPTFSPVAGTYSTAQAVSISSATSGASIRYTTDGSTPTDTVGTEYFTPVNISVNSTLKAIAYKSGTSSPVSSASYIITDTIVEAPTFDPLAGTYATAQAVTISSATSGATIRYTTNGTTPSETVGTEYTTPVDIGLFANLKAIAYKSGMTTSAVTTGSYTITSGNAGFTWTGVTNGSWTTLSNWLFDGLAASRYPGNGNNGDVVSFGIRNAGAFNPTSNQSFDDRVGSLTFQDAWDFNLGGRWLRMDGVTVNIPGVDGTARIFGSNGMQSYSNPTFSAAAGDTLVLDCYFKPTGSGNRTHGFAGGGTVAANGGFDNDSKVITYHVQGNTTLLNNNYMNSTGGNTGSLTVDAGSVAGGSGNFQVLTSTINGTVSPSSGNSNTGIGTLTFSGALALNGTYAADLSATTCDKINAGALTLGAASKLVVTGTPAAYSYVLAGYTSLTGTFDTGTSTLPPGYTLDYAFLGSNQIALVNSNPNLIATTTTMVSSNNPSFVGQTVTFTATIVPASGSDVPTGSVQFKVDGANLGSPVTVTPGGSADGTAAISTSAITVAGSPHAITAEFTANGSFMSSTGTLSPGQTVNSLITTTTTLVSSANPSNVGQSVTFTATITPASGTVAPTGSVQFKVDNVALGTPVTATPGTGSNGTAAISTSDITAAGSPHAVSAEFTASGGFVSSTGTLTPGQTVSNLTQYDLWAQAKGLTSGNNGAGDDPDGDGMTNQQEFAFGLNPMDGSSLNPIAAPLDKATGKFSYTRNATSGLNYTVWTSTNLSGWVGPADVTENVGPVIDGVVTVEVTLTAPPAGDKMFVRVQAD